MIEEKKDLPDAGQAPSGETPAEKPVPQAVSAPVEPAPRKEIPSSPEGLSPDQAAKAYHQATVDDEAEGDGGAGDAEDADDGDEEGDEPAAEAAPAAPTAEGQPGPAAQPPLPGQPGQQQQRQGRRRRRRGRGGRGGGDRQGPAQPGEQGQRQGGSDQAQRPAGQPGQDQRRRDEPRRDDRRRDDHRRDDHRRDERRRGERGEVRNDEHRGERSERGERRREGERSIESVERGGLRPPRPSGRKVKREILANSSFEETRIAILEDGRLAELLWERKSEESIVGNIYKGVVENVLPGISSAFVNIGFEKNAYLYISDVLGEKGASIDSNLKKGQHIMIQVAKEAIGTKGMKVTMDISLPGRFLVFTPFQTFVGVSKHIEDAAERDRLTAIVNELVATQLNGKGVVVRTEAEGASREELEREVKYLLAAWQNIQKKFDNTPPPTMLHEDLDLALQVARDILSDQVYVYLIDNKDAFKNVTDFINEISPELKERVRLYEAKTPIFKAFNLEKHIEELRQTKVPLPNGGSIVIQEAESLCAIDVNTGRFTGSKSQEETVTQTNIEAAQEVAHQLRLRNIGGIIVVDFIDMKKASNRNKVMEAFAQACRDDRAKIRILPITRLGLIELTRERKRESTVTFITDECPECRGAGRVLSAETMRIRIQREILELTAGRPGGQCRVLLHSSLADQFRAQQATIEKNVQRSVKIQSDPNLPREDYRIVLE